MGLRGKPNTPTAILKLRGTKRGIYDRKGEPMPAVGRPEHPDGLPVAAVPVWQQVCNLAGDMGVLTVADGAQLERYARMYVLWRRVQEVIDRYQTAESLALGWAGRDHRTVLRNAMAEARQLDTHLKQIEGNYGLTPSARARIACLMNGGGEGEQKDRRLGKFFGETGS